MENIARYAVSLAPPQLKLPDSARFSVDGQRIGQLSTSMAAKLPRPDPAVIMNITRVSEYLSSANEFAKTYQRPNAAN
ncbi:MAG: hypothetical protein EBT36_10840 [Betaproteobacteria bacterium]|nr:hypothetical protein [Betaproteobacteria bacterium]HAB48094.1 hypothetical protein [Lautropia sp.]NBQ95859.1 hypothetical protein [Betaproteobacteria bacterium]NBS39866.1 hypothetical protein [Betaproteobacteria bacterium]NBT71867.1 hypothetical protein [Betaproteobacteria bacterium]